MIDFGFDLAGQRDPHLRRGILLASLGATLDAAPVLVTFYALDALLSGRGSELDPLTLALGLTLLLVLTYLFRAAGAANNFGAAYRLVSATRLRLADHLRKLPLGFWSKRRQGAIASTLTDEFAQYTEIATHAWGLVIANIALPLALALLLLFAHPVLALVAFAPVPFALLSIPWSYRLLNRANDSLFAQKQLVSAQLVEYVSGLEQLRRLDAAERYCDRVALSLKDLEKGMMRTELAAAPAILTYSLLVHLGFALVVWIGAISIGAELPPLRYLLVCFLTVHFTRTLAELVLYLAAARAAGRTIERVRALMQTPEQDSATEETPAPTGDLCFEQVSFSYEETPALQNVSARLTQGSITALVGPSGSGKSTLAHLVSRLWDVDQGRITWGDVDLKEIPLPSLHRRVATVFQDVVLFQGSVLDNLRLGAPQATREEVIAAAKAARAHDFITRLPESYDTLLGPEGKGLSRGQRQRLSIARALLKDAELIVLDEATASVDVEEERLIQDAIAELTRGRTVLVIAHRLWTIEHVDQILVLDRGELLARGTHHELLSECARYKELWDAQLASLDWKLPGAEAVLST